MSTVHNFRQTRYNESNQEENIHEVDFSENWLSVWLLIQMNDDDASNTLQTDNLSE
ncbi:MAG: hypothetical protein KDC05_04215 [Bacteroidales bacterium]|nr:hypothetical protein [Bacteroidales bacterium]